MVQPLWRFVPKWSFPLPCTKKRVKLITIVRTLWMFSVSMAALCGSVFYWCGIWCLFDVFAIPDLPTEEEETSVDGTVTDGSGAVTQMSTHGITRMVIQSAPLAKIAIAMAATQLSTNSNLHWNTWAVDDSSTGLGDSSTGAADDSTGAAAGADDSSGGGAPTEEAEEPVVIATHFLRDPIYAIVSFFMMVVMDTFLENAQIVRPGDRAVVVLKTNIGDKLSAKAEREQTVWEALKLWVSELFTFHMLFAVYLRSIVSLTSSIIFWLATYNLIDEGLWRLSQQNEQLKNIYALVFGLVLMWPCGVLFSEAGLSSKREDREYEEAMRKAQEEGVNTTWVHSCCQGSFFFICKRYIHATLALSGIMTYWIGAWELIESMTSTSERSPIYPTMKRNILYIIFSGLVLLATDTITAQAGVAMDEVEEEEQKDLKQNKVKDPNKPPGFWKKLNNFWRSQTRCAKVTRRVLKYIRSLICLFAGMMMWVGVWDSLWTSDFLELGWKRYFTYALIGLGLLLVTGALVANGGVIPPLSITQFSLAKKVRESNEADENEEREYERGMEGGLENGQANGEDGGKSIHNDRLDAVHPVEVEMHPQTNAPRWTPSHANGNGNGFGAQRNPVSPTTNGRNRFDSSDDVTEPAQISVQIPPASPTSQQEKRMIQPQQTSSPKSSHAPLIAAPMHESEDTIMFNSLFSMPIKPIDSAALAQESPPPQAQRQSSLSRFAGVAEDPPEIAPYPGADEIVAPPRPASALISPPVSPTNNARVLGNPTLSAPSVTGLVGSPNAKHFRIAFVGKPGSRQPRNPPQRTGSHRILPANESASSTDQPQ